LKFHIAKIRTSPEDKCPFGLPIPGACKIVGDAVTKMLPGKANKIVNKSKPCIHAENIFKKFDAVNCDYGEQGSGIKEIPFGMSSPIYPRLWQGFNTVNLDTDYHRYTDSPHQWSLFSVSLGI